MIGGTYFDSRDVIERIAELESERDFYNEQPDCADVVWDVAYPDEAEELARLIELQDEVGGGEWEYGITFIRDSEWVDYVQEMCEDIGDVPRDLPHYIVIDWDATADNIQADYSTVEFDGSTYYYRNS